MPKLVISANTINSVIAFLAKDVIQGTIIRLVPDLNKYISINMIGGSSAGLDYGLRGRA